MFNNCKRSDPDTVSFPLHAAGSDDVKLFLVLIVKFIQRNTPSAMAW